MKTTALKFVAFLSLGMAWTSLLHAQFLYYPLYKEDPYVLETDTANMPIEEEITGRYIDGDWYEYTKFNGISAGVGYSYQSLYGPITSGIDYTYGFEFSLDGFYRRLYLGLNVLLQSRPLQTDNFYHDNKSEYDWVKGKATNTLPVTLRTGFCFIQRDRFRMTTYAGIGSARLSQETGYDPNHDNELNTSIIKGTRTELGLSADVLLYRLAYPHDGIELSVNIGGARTEYEYFGTAYSLNASIGLHFFFRPIY